MNRTAAAISEKLPDESGIDDAIEKLRDFPDRFSPIVVKELRQGLRQPAFVILFLFLQGVMALVMVGALLGSSAGGFDTRQGMGTMVSGFFFALFSLAVLLVQPIRGLGALATEIRSGTIDLLLLTRLDAWRITFGKWLSLMVQSALLLVALLPYLLMRYFLGGMQLFPELLWLLLLFLGGGVFCAGAVALSAVRSAILRGVVAVGAALGFLIVPQMVAMVVMVGGGPGSPMGGGWWAMGVTPWQSLLASGGIVLVLIYLAYAFLEFGATRIAPPAENRSGRKRLISLGALLVLPGLFALAGSDARFLTIAAALLIGGVALVDALSESPYVTRSAVRRWIGMLRPGWPSGARFGLVVIVIGVSWAIFCTLADASYVWGDISSYELLWIGVMVIGYLVVVQPAVFVAIFRSRDLAPAAAYLSVLLASTALGLAVLMVAAVAREPEFFAVVFLPIFPAIGFVGLDEYPEVAVWLASAFLVFYLILIAVIGRARWPMPRADGAVGQAKV